MTQVVRSGVRVVIALPRPLFAIVSSLLKLKKRGFVFYFSCKSCVCLLFTFWGSCVKPRVNYLTVKERSTKSIFFLGEFECEDKTDETEGCQLHGQAQDQCKSWNGNQFVTCPNDTSICTLPQFVDNCRQCDDANHWRCNDGWCIEKSRINDGVADCLDRSDEDSGTPILSIWVFETFSVCFF